LISNSSPEVILRKIKIVAPVVSTLRQKKNLQNIDLSPAPPHAPLAIKLIYASLI
jgi:hypothetical protein